MDTSAQRLAVISGAMVGIGAIGNLGFDRPWLAPTVLVAAGGWAAFFVSSLTRRIRAGDRG